MLFIVSDDPPTGNAAPGRSPSVKVELDIEDAPFLQEQEEQKAPVKEPERPAPPPPPVEEKKQSALQAKLAALLGNKKRLALIGGGLLLILLAPIGITLIFGGKDTQQPADPVRRIVPDEPPRDDAPPGPKFLFKSDLFLIERRGSEGEIRFLRCRFSIPTENPVLYGELRAKNIAVRDAIYYYLNNKPVVFLSDDMHTEVLKNDLISVINEHISSEKIQELYIEEYLVTRL